MPQLDPTFFFSQIFWLFLTFALLYLFVHFFFAPKISSVINMRTKQVKGDLSEAKNLSAQCDKIQASVTKSLEEVRTRANQIKQSAYAEAEQCIKSITRETDRQVKEKLKLGWTEIAKRKIALEKQSSDTAKSLSAQIVKIILQ